MRSTSKEFCIVFSLRHCSMGMVWRSKLSHSYCQQTRSARDIYMKYLSICMNEMNECTPQVWHFVRVNERFQPSAISQHQQAPATIRQMAEGTTGQQTPWGSFKVRHPYQTLLGIGHHRTAPGISGHRAPPGINGLWALPGSGHHQAPLLGHQIWGVSSPFHC